MGNRMCARAVLSMDAEITRMIDEQLKYERKRMANHRKVLLLGKSASGKSTFAHSAELMCGIPRRWWADEMIFSVFVFALKSFVEIAAADCKEKALSGLDLTVIEPLLEQHSNWMSQDRPGHDALELWMPLLEAFFEHRDAVITVASATPGKNDSYYEDDAVHRLVVSTIWWPRLADATTLFDPNYKPSMLDKLLLRSATTGLVEYDFDHNDHHITLIDVAGPRSERKRWAHCFTEVDAIVFCVDLSTFHYKLYEDETVTQYQQARHLFDDLINSKWFKGCNVILLGTHVDVLARMFRYPQVRDEIGRRLVVPSEDMTSYANFASWAMRGFAKVAWKRESETVTIIPGVSQLRPGKLWLSDIMDWIVEWPHGHELSSSLNFIPSEMKRGDVVVRWMMHVSHRVRAMLMLLCVRKFVPGHRLCLLPHDIFRLIFSFMPRDNFADDDLSDLRVSK
jgi:hypothetical protein